MSEICRLCLRDVPVEKIDDSAAVQQHHLVPENRRESPTVTLCRPCHKQIHTLFTNEELRESYDTVEKLREADRIQEYIDWIRGTNKLDINIDTADTE